MVGDGCAMGVIFGSRWTGFVVFYGDVYVNLGHHMCFIHNCGIRPE